MTSIGDLLVEFKEKPANGEEPPVLTLTERNGFVRQTERFNKRLATDDVSNYKVVRRDDIAFNPYLLWAGAVAQNTIVDKGIISPLYPTFRVRSNHDPRYVARLLLTPQLISAYDGIAFGSVPRRRRSSVADFLNLPLASIPPLSEQRRIAAILDKADAIRAQRRQVLAHLDSLPQAVFQDMFGHGVRATVRLDEVAAVSSGITKGRKTSDPTVLTPYLAVANVQAGHLNLELVKQIGATAAEVRRYALRAGDLVLTEGGDPDKLGRGTVWRGELPICLHQNHIFRVRPDNAIILSDYLSAFLAGAGARSYFMSCAKQTTGIASINMAQLRATPVMVPPIAHQQHFLKRAASITATFRSTKRALAATDALFASLQSRAFRGEL